MGCPTGETDSVAGATPHRDVSACDVPRRATTASPARAPPGCPGSGAATPARLSSAPVDCPVWLANLTASAWRWRVTTLLGIVMATSRRSFQPGRPGLMFYYYLPISAGLRDQPAKFAELFCRHPAMWLRRAGRWAPMPVNAGYPAGRRCQEW